VVDRLRVFAGAAAMERHPQRVQQEVGAHMRGELPADDHPAVGVEHEREVDESLPAAQIPEPEIVACSEAVAEADTGARKRIIRSGRVFDSRRRDERAERRAVLVAGAWQPVNHAALTRSAESVVHLCGFPTGGSKTCPQATSTADGFHPLDNQTEGGILETSNGGRPLSGPEEIGCCGALPSARLDATR
jgi:hypothetical protein